MSRCRVSPLHAMASTLAVAFALTLAPALLGCGQDEAPQPNPSNPSVAPANSPARAPVARDPERLRKELRREIELPDYYPEDAPIYPGSTTSSAGRPSGRVAAAFSTEDSTELVRAHVLGELASSGWSEVLVVEMPNGVVIHGKKDAREISVLISFVDPDTEHELTMMIVAIDP